MGTGAIAYRILNRKPPEPFRVIKTLLEKHPWYADRWRHHVEKGKFVNAVNILMTTNTDKGNKIRLIIVDNNATILLCATLQALTVWPKQRRCQNLSCDTDLLEVVLTAICSSFSI